MIAVLKLHASLLNFRSDPQNTLLLLFAAVYKYMDGAESKPVITPPVALGAPEFVEIHDQFQSMDYAEKAITSLFLIERFPPYKIAQITQIPASEIDIIIAKSLELLSNIQSSAHAAS